MNLVLTASDTKLCNERHRITLYMERLAEMRLKEMCFEFDDSLWGLLFPDSHSDTLGDFFFFNVLFPFFICEGREAEIPL